MKIYTPVYFAKFQTGEILESTDLRTFYHIVRKHLRTEYGHSLYFNHGTTTICKAVLVEWHSNAMISFHYTNVQPLMTMVCYSCDKVTHYYQYKEWN